MHDDDVPEETPYSEDLARLALIALEQGIGAVNEGGPLVPFVLTEEGQHRRLEQFMAPTFEEGIGQARAYAGQCISGRVVIVFDGYLCTPEGDQFDAIYAHAFEAGQLNSHVFAQRYRPADDAGDFGLIDEPVYCGEEDSLF